ncbi:MAG TPA: STAS domain-containing protein [Vicinamibacterales bacterium]|nr:STAS domain-containing protein [Vicinamibacterales bacterium]
MAASLQISERRTGDVTVVALAGRLVIDTGARVFQEHVDRLLQEGRVKLVVCLRDVSYVDSGGVGMLVAKYLSARRNGGDLKLVCLSSRACHVLGIAGLLRVFAVFDTEEAAVRAYSMPPEPGRADLQSEPPVRRAPQEQMPAYGAPGMKPMRPTR